MQIEILQDGRPLRQIHHQGQVYVEAPTAGAYAIRLTNDSPHRRGAVLSVDGTNVIDGKEAGHDGAEFVLEPWQSVDVKGWLRSSSEAAAFEFVADTASYAAAVGRGTKNVGVIGLAVFDEKPKPVFVPPTLIIRERTLLPRYRRYQRPWWDPFDGPWCGVEYDNHVLGSSFSADEMGLVTKGIVENMTSASVESPATASTAQGSAGPTRGRSKSSKAFRGRGATDAPVQDVGTVYGSRVTMHTRQTTFERAGEHPVLVRVLRYATREKLRSWGVPVDAAMPPAVPNPFPASPGFAPAPAGWRG
jgi:hypothetical protein